ncbi:MAG: M20/M25/M40 family metallo-hydrolase, partial [Acidobacteriota bacterium]|nr:M20/M25/M40 family metallo-hydrolase [Acidobacteriota bacterium]
SAPLPNVALSITVDAVRRERPAHNVVGVLEGSDPNLKNESIIIGAHYDHLGRGGQGSLARREGEIHHGADDNASGTAGLIELARLFAGERSKLRRTIVFIAFGGEEEGLLGSNFYVNNPAVPLAQTIAMINMDMIGRLKEDRLMIGGAGTASEWRGWIERINADPNIKMVAASGGVEPASVNVSGGEFPVVIGANGRVMATANPRGRFALALSEDGFGPSDHSSFYAKKIPVLFFFTGTHEDYHKPSDTAEKINYAGEARVLSFVREIVSELQASERRPTYAVARSQSAGRTATGFRVYLGTVPNYADSTDGMKLDAVRDDSPAAKAGLHAGDVIVKLAGREIRNVYDYTYALGEMKAGQEYDVEVMRDGKRMAMKLTPAARK